jgi:hypothetical protein
MITEPTVLILGAGASYPYTFPTAKELKGLICDAFATADTTASRLLGDTSDFEREDFCNFREAFWRSGQPSVDAFLEHRKDFLGIGKFAIAYCLIPFEDENMLYRPNPARGGDWYEYLSVKLNASFEDFGANKLSIITFNYDRSLEHYLFTALRNLHGRPVEECKKKLAEIPIIHVYGQLGKEPYPQPGSRPYDPDHERYANVARAALGITLLHEEASGLEEARKLLTDARRICFLGFSYHPLNIGRLQLQDSSSRQVFGTVHGLVGGEVAQVRTTLHSVLLTATVTVSDIDHDNLYFLRQHLILG